MSKLSDLLVLPSYKVKLPILNQEVEYRPFVTKEQRILLQAQQEGNEKSIIEAVLKMIDQCTFGKLKVERLHHTDIEFLLLKIRSNSVGAEHKTSEKCPHCEAINEIAINSSNLQQTPFKDVENPIELQENLWIKMRPPAIIDILIAKEKDPFELIIKCIESIISGDQVIPTSEQSPQEVKDFVDLLQESQQEKIKNYLDSFPELYIPYEYTCSKCKNKVEGKVEGVLNFFI